MILKHFIFQEVDTQVSEPGNYQYNINYQEGLPYGGGPDEINVLLHSPTPLVSYPHRITFRFKSLPREPRTPKPY